MSKSNDKKKILIADSSSLVISILKNILEKEGFAVLSANDGNTALELIKTEKPICVAVNFKLPLIDGPSLCRIIKQGMELDFITSIVFSIDSRCKHSADFSYVDFEILASDHEVEDLFLCIKKILNYKEIKKIDEKVTISPELPTVTYVARAMEQNIQKSYIMECLYQCGVFFRDLEFFAQKLIQVVRDVFSTDAAVLIVNSKPVQIYAIGITDDDFGKNLLNVCISDFKEQDIARSFSTYETHFVEDGLKNPIEKKENFNSYKYFPLIGDDLLGSIHIAFSEKLKLTSDLDDSINFFAEKASMFLSQAIFYHKTSQIETRLRGAFSRFVPEEIIDELAEVGDADIASTNEKRKVAVLISDIRNFTSISEINQPEKVVSFLNGYFTRMVDVIKKHGGTIDKFMGDAVMALFGAPVSYEDNARRAVEAALEMKALIPEISCESLSFPEDTSFDIGIGIHYGEVIAGSIGCKEKTDYTVIGDTVNLASRLEGLTKSYSAGIIISDAVKCELPETYNLLHLDNVKVKGKSVGVEIYRVDSEPVSPEYENYYVKALELYESGAWNLAKSYFEKASKHSINDKSALMMAQRCEKFIQNPPKNWDGAFSLTKK